MDSTIWHEVLSDSHGPKHSATETIARFCQVRKGLEDHTNKIRDEMERRNEEKRDQGYTQPKLCNREGQPCPHASVCTAEKKLLADMGSHAIHNPWIANYSSLPSDNLPLSPRKLSFLQD